MAVQVFADYLKRSQENQLSLVELLGAAEQICAANELGLAEQLYESWIEHNQQNPMVHAAHFNYAVVLSNNNQLQKARAAYEAAIAINPDFYASYINLGVLHERMGAGGEAVQIWYQVINRLHAVNTENISHKLTTLKQLGRVLEQAKIDVNAEDALRRSLEISPNQPDILQHFLNIRQRQLKWPVIEPWSGYSRANILGGISPLTLAGYSDDPMLQLATAHSYCKTEIGKHTIDFLDAHKVPQPREPGERLRIGYISSDLRGHAVGMVAAELFELHDRSKVEVFVYYCGISASDSFKERIKNATEHWCDIASLNEQAVARLILDDKIQILVDLNGHTRGSALKTLNMRPAPVIVNWLGYPGTMGSPCHHYIIADDFIIPKDSEVFYSEKVKRLPCYQPNDRKKVVAKSPTRAEVGLPEDAMVYCSFNGVQKLTSFTWGRWMSILKLVPNSVLWMLATEPTTDRLRELASEYGVAPERLFFAAPMANADHVARYPLADLFLDSFPYGAHTTASDALWMGVPMVTLAGRGFAARVCGSLVKSAGVEELICTTADEYVAKAVALGTNHQERQALRDRLVANRNTNVLFDSPSMTAHLEALYEEMWDEYKQGKLPRPDFSNLDIYQDIGVNMDRNDVEIGLQPNYIELYREKLAERDRLCFIRDDERLWPGV